MWSNEKIRLRGIANSHDSDVAVSITLNVIPAAGGG